MRRAYRQQARVFLCMRYHAALPVYPKYMRDICGPLAGVRPPSHLPYLGKSDLAAPAGYRLYLPQKCHIHSLENAGERGEIKTLESTHVACITSM